MKVRSSRVPWSRTCKPKSGAITCSRPRLPKKIGGNVNASTFEIVGRAKKPAPRFPGTRATVDGSGAVVWVESNISQGAVAYPITPSTPMGDGFAAEFSNGKRNLWDEPIQFPEPESEHS